MSKKVETPQWVEELVFEALDFMDCSYKPQITCRSDDREGYYRGFAQLPYKKGTHRSATYWRNAWKLYKHFGLDLEKVLENEKKYRVEAEKQFVYLSEKGKL